MDNTFWLDNPCILFTNLNFIPASNLSLNERLNALTRIVLVTTGVLYYIEYQYWSVFLLASLLIIFGIKITSKQEDFTIPPTYIEGAEPMTTVPPLFAEEWQSPPPIYDEYTNSPPACPSYESGDDRPIYGQYITYNNLEPYTANELSNRPLDNAKLFMNDEFTRDTLQFRNDMSRGFVNKLDRWYRHGCYDQISPANSC